MADDTRLIPVSGPQAAEIQGHADESVAALPNDEIRRRYQQAVTLLRSLADSYEDAPRAGQVLGALYAAHEFLESVTAWEGHEDDHSDAFHEVDQALAAFEPHSGEKR